MNEITPHPVTGAKLTYNVATDWLSLTFPGRQPKDVTGPLKEAGFRFRGRGPYKAWKCRWNTHREDVALSFLVDRETDVEVIAIEPDWNKRADARDEYAAQVAAQASALWSEHRAMLDVIPFGQPILVGHHSEQRDRNYRARADRKARKSIETSDRAESIKRGADRARWKAERAQDADVREKKVKTLEKEIRRFTRDDPGRDVEFCKRVAAHLTRQRDYHAAVLAMLRGEDPAGKDAAHAA